MDSLLDDLGSLGLHFEFRQGVDWGYGASLGKKRNGISSLLITTDAMERLKSHGVRQSVPVAMLSLCPFNLLGSVCTRCHSKPV